jgi:hypothetical protein
LIDCADKLGQEHLGPIWQGKPQVRGKLNQALAMPTEISAYLLGF